MDKEKYEKIMEEGRKNFVRGINRVYWKFCTDKDYKMAGFKVGFYNFSFTPSRKITEKFIDFLKFHQTSDNFPIFTTEIASFFKENKIEYSINFKGDGKMSLLKRIRSYIIYKKTVKQFNI